jgi:hypothetical protein
VTDRPTTVCWIQHGGEIEWAKAIAAHLRDSGIAVRFVSFLRDMADGYAASSWPSDFISEIFAPANRLTDAELAKLERRYGPPSLRCLAASDVHLRLLYGNDEAAKVQIIGRALQYWERYFARHDIRAAIVRDQASFSTRCARQVADRLGTVRMIQLGLGPDDEHFALYDVDANSVWSELIKEVSAGPRRLSPERIAAVNAYVDKRVQRVRPRPMSLNLNAPSLADLPVTLYRLWQAERAVDTERDPMGVALVRLQKEFMLKRSLWRATRPLFRYDEPGPEPYVYFPLFHLEESGHLINIRYWCRHFEDLAAQIAEALPLGHLLYVKEHPAILGDLPRRALRRMQKNPRIRIIAPEVQSQTLIANAGTVVTLEGTVGWEAILLRRPLVVLSGKSYYVHCPAVFVVDDVCRLDLVLPEAIFSDEARYAGSKEDDWRWFIDCVLRTAPAGVLETYEYPHVTPQQAENLANVANAIGRKVHELASSGAARVAASL